MEAKERAYSMGSTASQGQTPSLVSAPSRRMSGSSSLTSRSRKISRIEMVNMPGGAMLLEVEERDDDAVSILSRRDSLSGALTVGGVTALPDTAYFDKKIKIEMAHHSPAVGSNPGADSGDEGEEDTATDAVNEESKKDKDPLLSYGLSNVLNHLCLALASPAFFRLPALAYKWSSKTGSGFFLVYCIMLFVVALPISVLEQTMAQFSSLGTVTIFRCLPLLTGVGVGMMAACSVLMVYTSTVFTWSTLYLFDCMHPKLPWEECTNGTNYCVEFEKYTLGATDARKYLPNDFYFLDSVAQAFEPRSALSPNLSLALIQLFLWLALVILVSRREVWQSGIFSKVMALLTLAMLVALVTVGLTSRESGAGLYAVFKLHPSNLAKPDIWLDALGQAVWTLGPTLGILISRASYKRFRERIRLDAYTAVGVNIFVALLLHLALFPFLTSRVPTDSALVSDKSPGYFFIISSYAVAQMQEQQLAGVVLYLCVCKALLDHTNALAATVLVSINDLLPIKWRSGGRRFTCECLVCLGGLLASLFFVSRGGFYLLNAMDAYIPWMYSLVLGLLEVSGLVYLYGTKNITKHFHVMIRKKTVVFPVIWKFILSPVLLALLIWVCVVGVKGPQWWDHPHLTEADEKVYSGIGLALALFPVCLCPVATLVVLYSNRKSPRELLEPRPTWGPALAKHRAFYTPGILKIHTRKPFLVVKVDYENIEDLPPKGWIPYGYFKVPSMSMPQYLFDNLSSVGTTTKKELARYLKAVFSNIHESDDWVNDDLGEENPIATIARENGSDIDLFSGDIINVDDPRPRSSASMSSGVLLQPTTLYRSDDKLHYQLPVHNGPFNPVFIRTGVDVENK
ncbi:sodium-dependent noradrenaline transporter-like [Penaeus monodon]|uniref:sodium-dependent noradrenaline transporter-like n=1 Tax=Penaeus monodon TaxID=6687 RepID=UPI0018A7C7BB|nr:sodium-dependent noradrenaline transporter-like [Penaeus monodon]